MEAHLSPATDAMPSGSLKSPVFPLQSLPPELIDRIGRFCVDYPLALPTASLNRHLHHIFSKPASIASRALRFYPSPEHALVLETRAGRSATHLEHLTRFAEVAKKITVGYESTFALAEAARRGYDTAVGLLLQRGAYLSFHFLQAILLAVEGDHINAVHLLLAYAVREDETQSQSLPAKSLLWAAQHGSIRVVNLLLDRGVDVNMWNGQFLAAAAVHGHMNVLKLLLERGADPSLSGFYALQQAAEQNHFGCVEVLLDYLECKGNCHGEAMRAAAARGNRAMVELLLDRNVDPSNGYYPRGTPLKWAVGAYDRHDTVSTIQLLIERGARVDEDVVQEAERIHALGTCSGIENIVDHLQQEFDLPKDPEHGLVNNSKDSFDFRFDGVFDHNASQDEVFDVVAKPVVMSVLDGYNGTVFAYGQTGSGKTFTITGGAARYADRGIIPRALQAVFAEIERRGRVRASPGGRSRAGLARGQPPGGSLHSDDPDSDPDPDPDPEPEPDPDTTPSSYHVHVAYLEIYNEQGYDLLGADVASADVEDLAGQARRLEDLPSERISRTSLSGATLLREARLINLSLHHLEQCIVALHEKAQGKRDHVPYRNSVLTCVLMDSLGGNCRTVMVATVVGDAEGVEESISTCRFAQRVASISNTYTLNEEMDPSVLIARLRREIVSLRGELALARRLARVRGAGQNGDRDGEGDGEGDDEGDELPEYERERVRRDVEAYVGSGGGGGGDMGVLDGAGRLCWGDTRKVVYGFEVMKDMVLSRGSGGGGGGTSPSSLAHTHDVPDDLKAQMAASQAQVEKLRTLVGHRDREIAVLVGTINKFRERGQGQGQGQGQGGAEHEVGRISFASHHSLTAYPTPSNPPATLPLVPPNPTPTTTYPSSDTFDFFGDLGGWAADDAPASPSSPTPRVGAQLAHLRDPPALAALPPDKAKAFERFRSTYPENSWIEDHKSVLKEKYAEAKRLGGEAGSVRDEIKRLKAWLENAEGGKIGVVKESEKKTVRDKLTANVARYKSSYASLKSLKMEIDHIHHLLDTARIKLTKDFERWFVTEYLVGKADARPDDRERTVARRGSARGGAQFRKGGSSKTVVRNSILSTGRVMGSINEGDRCNEADSTSVMNIIITLHNAALILRKTVAFIIFDLAMKSQNQAPIATPRDSVKEPEKR
ncbi:Kinesin- protein 6, partial [Gonapodya sp. JEL0774]